MSIPQENEKEFANFPEVLRELVIAELAAGNEIAEFSHGFPAAPCGAYIKLAKPVTSRIRHKTPELDFYDRDGSSHSGEFTDEKRHFFVLEPPRPPQPPPDMDAIRAKKEADYAAANDFPPAILQRLGQQTPDAPAVRVPQQKDPKSVISSFKDSMLIDYDKWREGIGYDLDILKQASPEELLAIENLLISRQSEDWRDIEALAAIGSERAKEVLKDPHRAGDSRVKLAVHTYAPESPTDAERLSALIQALEQSDLYGGLSQALDQVEDFHPPEIVAALLHGAIERDGGAACHFAAMLYYIHGKAKTAFDWDHRPFFLRFNTTDKAERETAFIELCSRIGVDPQIYIKKSSNHERQ